MQVWLRKISRLVLLVMLTTVFSPSFGWEAAEGMAVHEHAMPTEHEHHDDAVAAQTLAEDCADAHIIAAPATSLVTCRRVLSKV